ncbi:MAG TPA: hypothetical protein VGO93_06095 [Candidatus Xenobia bacterium]
MEALQSWKHTLSQGHTVQVRATSDLGTVQPGDTVTVAPSSFRELKRGDVVLCSVSGRPGLRKIAQCRDIYGVRCLEVMEGAGLHYVQESTVYGRMVYARKMNGQVVAPDRVINSVHAVVRGLKRVLFPGA